MCRLAMTSRPGHRLRGSPRLGFTLIEILVALGILLMVAALVGPALFEQMGPRSFDYAMGRLAGEIRVAREDARRTGELTFVYATPDAEARTIRIESRTTLAETEADGAFGSMSTGVPGSASMPGSFAGAPGTAGGAPPGFMTDEDERVRVLYELPESMRLTAERPAFLTADAGFGDTMTADAMREIGGLGPSSAESGESGMLDDPFADDLEGIGGIAAGGEPILIAVCVPDGTVLCPRDLWLIDDEERAARLVINTASGVIVCKKEARETDPFGAGDAGGFESDPGGDLGRAPATRRGARRGATP